MKADTRLNSSKPILGGGLVSNKYSLKNGGGAYAPLAELIMNKMSP